MTVHPLLALAVALVAADAPKDDAKKDLDKLQGTWAIASATYDGADLPDNLDSKLSFQIKGDQFTVTGDEETVKAYKTITLKLEQSTKPRSVDFVVGEGGEKGNTVEGIYEITGPDEFKVAAKLDAKERPTEFKSPENSHIALITFKRQSK